MKTLGLRAGEAVEVRSREEILLTLDTNGALDGLPFMPEMLRWCGKRAVVGARADKTCDTIEKSGGRRMLDTVHLEGLRCDGEAHGGCQAGCLLFWKEAWLKRPDRTSESLPSRSEPASRLARIASCDERLLAKATGGLAVATAADVAPYVWQATELRRATSPLAWWDVRQYVRDVTSGNVHTRDVLRSVGARTILNLLERVQRLPGGYRVPMALSRAIATRWSIPMVEGHLTKTPAAALHLKPGDRVRVKSRDDIFATLDSRHCNRGLRFDIEMLAYCGREFTVLRRVERIINEKTGTMMLLPNDCIVLDGAVCPGRLSAKRLLCPRGIYPFWREIWLEKVH